MAYYMIWDEYFSIDRFFKWLKPAKEDEIFGWNFSIDRFFKWLKQLILVVFLVLNFSIDRFFKWLKQTPTRP